MLLSEALKGKVAEEVTVEEAIGMLSAAAPEALAEASGAHALQTKLIATQRGCHDAMERLQDMLHQAMRRQQQALQNQQAAMLRLKSEYQEKLTMLQKELAKKDELARNAAKAESVQVKEQQEAIVMLKGMINGMEEERRHLQDAFQANRDRLSIQQNELEEEKSKTKGLELGLAEVNGLKNRLCAAMTRVRADVEQAKMQPTAIIHNLQAQQMDLLQQLTGLKAKNTELSRRLEETKSELADSQTRNSKSEDSLGKLQVEFDRRSEELDGLKEETSQLENSWKQMQILLDAKEDVESDELTSKVEELKKHDQEMQAILDENVKTFANLLAPNDHVTDMDQLFELLKSTLSSKAATGERCERSAKAIAALRGRMRQMPTIPIGLEQLLRAQYASALKMIKDKAVVEGKLSAATLALQALRDCMKSVPSLPEITILKENYDEAQSLSRKRLDLIQLRLEAALSSKVGVEKQCAKATEALKAVREQMRQTPMLPTELDRSLRGQYATTLKLIGDKKSIAGKLSTATKALSLLWEHIGRAPSLPDMAAIHKNYEEAQGISRDRLELIQVHVQSIKALEADLAAFTSRSTALEDLARRQKAFIVDVKSKSDQNYCTFAQCLKDMYDMSRENHRVTQKQFDVYRDRAGQLNSQKNSELHGLRTTLSKSRLTLKMFGSKLQWYMGNICTASSLGQTAVEDMSEMHEELEVCSRGMKGKAVELKLMLASVLEAQRLKEDATNEQLDRAQGCMMRMQRYMISEAIIKSQLLGESRKFASQLSMKTFECEKLTLKLRDIQTHVKATEGSLQRMKQMEIVSRLQDSKITQLALHNGRMQVAYLRLAGQLRQLHDYPRQARQLLDRMLQGQGSMEHLTAYQRSTVHKHLARLQVHQRNLAASILSLKSSMQDVIQSKLALVQNECDQQIRKLVQDSQTTHSLQQRDRANMMTTLQDQSQRMRLLRIQADRRGQQIVDLKLRVDSLRMALVNEHNGRELQVAHTDHRDSQVAQYQGRLEKVHRWSANLQSRLLESTRLAHGILQDWSLQNQCLQASTLAVVKELTERNRGLRQAASTQHQGLVLWNERLQAEHAALANQRRHELAQLCRKVTKVTQYTAAMFALFDRRFQELRALVAPFMALSQSMLQREAAQRQQVYALMQQIQSSQSALRQMALTSAHQHGRELEDRCAHLDGQVSGLRNLALEKQVESLHLYELVMVKLEEDRRFFLPDWLAKRELALLQKVCLLPTLDSEESL